VTGGPPACVSSDGGVGVKVMGPCVSERGERGERMGTKGDGNAISSQSHLAQIEGGRGERRQTKVTVLVMEQGRGSKARQSG
jgi:hypothetical protein